MFDALLATVSLWWFFNTEYFNAWCSVRIGGDQISISLTALIVVVYIMVIVGSVLFTTYRKRC